MIRPDHVLSMLSLMLALRAQDSQIPSAPALGDAMPLIQSADGVHVRFPVLINAHTVVQPASTLRVVYLDPNAGMHGRSGGGAGGGGRMGGMGGGGGHHPGGGGSGSPGGDASGGDASAPDTPPAPDDKAASKGANTEVWKQVQPFRDALNAPAIEGTTIVFAVPGKPRPTSAELDLPGGMLLGSPNGKIIALALTSDSEAREAGLRPRDELRALNGQPVPTNLEAFARFYQQLTDQARKAGTAYNLQVWRPDQSALIDLKVGAPPSLPSMF